MTSSAWQANHRARPTQARPDAKDAASVTGACVNPIRLRALRQLVDEQTGELLGGTASVRDAAVILVSCKDRRACRCPWCSRLYACDAYHLLAAGVRGGKGVGEDVRAHPAVMVTLTAPSFGAVHRNHAGDRPCRCGLRHQADDPSIGHAIDPGSYRYREQVVWNRYAPELWKRTIARLRLELSAALGVSRSHLGQVARLRFAKVAEFQRRGVVHYHALVRLDGPSGAGSGCPDCSPSALAELVERAAAVTAIELPARLADALGPATLRWGSQREIVVLDSDTRAIAAGYIAKYTTKATEEATGGTLLGPIRSKAQLEHMELASHPRRLVLASWSLARQTGDEAFRRWAHQFGYGGHTLTKSRGFSTTFDALRKARAQWQAGVGAQSGVLVHTTFAFAGHARAYTATFRLAADDITTGRPSR
jgi:hypothetical protein